MKSGTTAPLHRWMWRLGYLDLASSAVLFCLFEQLLSVYFDLWEPAELVGLLPVDAYEFTGEPPPNVLKDNKIQLLRHNYFSPVNMPCKKDPPSPRARVTVTPSASRGVYWNLLAQRFDQMVGGKGMWNHLNRFLHCAMLRIAPVEMTEKRMRGIAPVEMTMSP
jgi:hypothetical protein